MNKIFLFTLVISFVSLFPELTTAQSALETNEKQLRAAILDYVEGIYNVQPDRIRRSVSKDLVKQGYYRPRNSTEYSLSPMSFEELIHTAETYNKRGWIPQDAPKKIEIYDVSEKVASAKLEAIWGFDYMMLGKDDSGKWKIVQVLWQSYPAKKG